MSPVEHHADQGPVLIPGLGRPPHPEGGNLAGRVESVALQEDGIGHEAEQMLEVPGAAVDQVGERLGDGGAGDGREAGHLGVRPGLATESQQGYAATDAAGPELVEPLGPGTSAPKQPNEYATNAVERQGIEGVEGPGLRRPDRVEAGGEGLDRGAQGQHLGVDVGDEPDHGWRGG